MSILDDFNLGAYLTNSVENIVKTAIRATLKNPKESAFMARYAMYSSEAARKRVKAAKNGENIPPFLIASITSACNLHCAGCYSRQIHSCSDDAPQSQLTVEEWSRVFTDARELGIDFIILAGGEPLLHADVIEAAGEITEILFPVITNGTLCRISEARAYSRQQRERSDISARKSACKRAAKKRKHKRRYLLHRYLLFKKYRRHKHYKARSGIEQN